MTILNPTFSARHWAVPGNWYGFRKEPAGVGLCVSCWRKEQTSMKKCTSCQSEIDDKAKKCPHCQADQRNWFMRHKILTGLGGIACLLLILAIANSPSGGSNTGSENASQSVKDTVYAINQDVPSGDVVWKITGVRDRGTSLLARESRYPTIAKTKTTTGRFIELTVVIENKGKDLASITTPSLVDSQNREFTSSSDVSEWVPEGKDLFLLSNLQPNLPKEFVVIYEVPPGAVGLKAKVGVLRPQLIDLGV